MAGGEVIKICGKIRGEERQISQLTCFPIRLRGDKTGTTNQWEISKGKIKSRHLFPALSIHLSSFLPGTTPVPSVKEGADGPSVLVIASGDDCGGIYRNHDHA